MRKRAKVDQTHGPIVEAFRKGGWLVLSLAPLGNGAPDLLVASPQDRLVPGAFAASFPQYGDLHRFMYLIECKGEKGKLRPGQDVFGRVWPVHVLRSVDDAVKFMRTH